MHKRQKHFYVGVDLHKQHHVAVIINCWQEKLAELTVVNKPSAFSTFLLDIDKLMEEGLTPVFGLEDGRLWTIVSAVFNRPWTSCKRSKSSSFIR
ncbi:hypothetical protein J2S19_004466 [Metabacillus malikii]|uniref:Transposase IS111A/IS1328/IS1533 N-terminal domain-containing protein n=1 Tax=Metabacillus malikii TaxID=1504265 RepID=A0ABT9ZLF2_9BACI|nr:hypothetical protein [Metabacillus malikii]